MKKIVVASDSFKGSVSSMQVATAARHGLLSVWPECNVECVPVGDGGEGTVDTLIAATGGRRVECEVEGPLGEPLTAAYCILPDGVTAVLEMASAAGLTLIPVTLRNPWLTSTYGVGQMMVDALQRGCRDILLCIGGSASNDAATGMMQALGYRLLDSKGMPLGRGGRILGDVAHIDATHAMPALAECSITVACDVQNPFYGPQGAACVFARQKGADDAMIEQLDLGMRHFAQVLESYSGIDVQKVAGAGAAGGMGATLVAVFGARLKPGIDMVLDAIDFDRKISGAQLVITGEGRLDNQTCMGKTPYGVMKRAALLGIPTVAIGGAVSDADALINAGFAAVLPILPGPVSLQQAIDTEYTMQNISRTAAQLARIINTFSHSEHV